MSTNDLRPPDASLPLRACRTRRDFLSTSFKASAVLGFPTVIPSSALGKDGAVAPSERLTFAAIGTGGKGRHNLGVLMKHPEVEVVALCDPADKHLAEATGMVQRKTNKAGVKGYPDYRQMLAAHSCDIVCVSTPDHWHALATVAALDKGADVYCEKPLANSVGEGRAIADAAKRNKKLVQTGSMERSHPNARFAAELVRSGRIGKLKEVLINLPADDGHHKQARALKEIPAAEPIPKGFDYNLWLGHTPLAPYHSKRCHFWWRFILAYGGGEMTDRGAHVIDLAQLGMGTDDTGPVKVEAKGARTEGSLYDAFWDYNFVNTYANGLRMVGVSKGPRGVKFIGEDGWIFVHVHGCRLEASEPAILKTDADSLKVKLGRSPKGDANGHHRNFLDCVKSRKAPMATAAIGHRTATICHLNNIAMQTGASFQWDPVKEQTDSAKANALLMPKMRAPWSLPKA